MQIVQKYIEIRNFENKSTRSQLSGAYSGGAYKKECKSIASRVQAKLCFEKVNPQFLTVLFRTIYDTNLSIKEDKKHKQTEIHKKMGERP